MAATPASPPKIAPLTYAPAATNTDTGITATAGGVQSNAYQLTAQFSKIATVATTNDSVQLPPIVNNPYKLGSIGSQVIVRNAGANSLQIYGAYSTSDTINDVASATGVAIPSGKTAIFVAHTYTSTGSNWYMVLSA
jgi:hypothetical protein